MFDISMTTPKHNTIAMIMLISAFVFMLNQTILNIALPAIIKGLNIAETTAQWSITGFILVNGMMTPFTASLMDKYSTRHLCIFSMAIFLIGFTVAVFSPMFTVLMISRIIQAIGAGILLPLMQFTVFILFPAEQRGFAVGLAGMVVQSASAIGPTLTGLFVDLFSWRMSFYLVSAVVVVAFISGFFFVEDSTKTKDIVLDRISVAYSTFGFGLILLASSSTSTFDITSLPVIVTFVLSIATTTIFTTYQLKLKHPLLNMRALKNKVFMLSTVSSMLAYITMVSPALLIPIYTQTGLGQLASLSGVAALPGAVINGLTMTYAGKILDKHSIRVLVTLGFILLISMTFSYSFLTTGTLCWFVILAYTIRMITLGLLVMPPSTVGLNALELDDVSHGTVIMNSLCTTTGVIGTVANVTILSIVAKQYIASYSTVPKMRLTQETTVHGIDAAFIFTTVLIIIGFISASSIKEEKNH